MLAGILTTIVGSLEEGRVRGALNRKVLKTKHRQDLEGGGARKCLMTQCWWDHDKEGGV